ncbi:MAG TPA: hypothetical protein VGH32_03430 [Pirellulales bacterium]
MDRSEGQSSTRNAQRRDEWLSAAWAVFAVYAVATPIMLACLGFDLSFTTKDSRNLVVISLVLPIAFCGWLILKYGRRIGAIAAFCVVIGAALGQWLGLFTGFSFLDPLILSAGAAGLGLLLGLIVIEPALAPRISAEKETRFETDEHERTEGTQKSRK